MRTVQAMRACGIKIEQPEPEMLVVHGKRRLLTLPPGEIDCGNSPPPCACWRGCSRASRSIAVWSASATLSGARWIA